MVILAGAEGWEMSPQKSYPLIDRPPSPGGHEEEKQNWPTAIVSTGL